LNRGRGFEQAFFRGQPPAPSRRRAVESIDILAEPARIDAGAIGFAAMSRAKIFDVVAKIARVSSFFA
jgi:hypothetical protein